MKQSVRCQRGRGEEEERKRSEEKRGDEVRKRDGGEAGVIFALPSISVRDAPIDRSPIEICRYSLSTDRSVLSKHVDREGRSHDVKYMTLFSVRVLQSESLELVLALASKLFRNNFDFAIGGLRIVQLVSWFTNLQSPCQTQRPANQIVPL